MNCWGCPRLVFFLTLNSLNYSRHCKNVQPHRQLNSDVTRRPSGHQLSCKDILKVYKNILLHTLSLYAFPGREGFITESVSGISSWVDYRHYKAVLCCAGRATSHSGISPPVPLISFPGCSSPGEQQRGCWSCYQWRHLPTPGLCINIPTTTIRKSLNDTPVCLAPE